VTAAINQQPNPLLRGSFPLLLVFLFSIFSAAMEVIPLVGKVRPQLILAVLGLLAVFGTGQFMKVLSSPIGRCVALFTAWFIACIPFGAWPGGSFGVFTESWYKAALIFLLTAGLLTTLPQAIRLYRTIACAVGILAVLTLLKNNRSSDGRLVLDNTRYANSNDLAWTLLVGLIFIGFLYLRGSRWHKVIAALMVPPVLLTLSRTGSRTGMLGAGLLAVVALAQAKRATRIKLLAWLPVALLAVLIVMPKDMLLRYTTFFGTYDKYNLSHAEKVRMGTIASTESRKNLLIDSLIVTAKHPLLGVGPGNFMVVQNEMAQARGEQSLWHVTHNTYTQVSSEMGVPGLVIYGAFLFSIFRVLNSIARNRYPGAAWRDLRQLALTLRAAFIVFLAVAFFDSLAYNADMPILAGITAALGFMAQKQRAIDRAASAPMVSEEAMLEPGLEPVAVGRY
jgi:O-antigen ligase